MRMLALAFSPRFIIYTLSVLFAAALLHLAILLPASIPFVALPLAVFVFFSIVGTWDLLQTRHSVLRNYPISAHLRFLLEHMRPEMRQYFFEDEKDGHAVFTATSARWSISAPRCVLDKRPFGTQYDVYATGFEWVRHSMAPRPARGRAVPHHHRRAGLREALQRLGVQHLGDELRRARAPTPSARSTRAPRAAISPTTPARAA